jgi:alanine racemase
VAGLLTPPGANAAPRAFARVDLARLAANYRAVAAFAGRPLMPVVKADAYGHGAPRVARVFESLGAPLLTVAYAEEAVAIRRAGVRVPILVLAGCWPGEEPVFLEHSLTPAVVSDATLEGAMSLARSGPVAVHVKVDTGMSRLGFTLGELAPLARRLVEAGVAIEGLMTHLSSADEDAHTTEAQLDKFDIALADLEGHGHRPRWVHAANSAGLAFLRPTHTLVRPGLFLYGVRPRPLSPSLDVRPVMTLGARIAHVREVPGGTTVSYGARWVARRPSRIATIALGYADGVPRTEAMAVTGYLTIHDQRAPIAGTVCMDFVMADVTEIPEAVPGDEALVFGDAPTVWDVASRAGTTSWQVLTAVGPRVTRVYVNDTSS